MASIERTASPRCKRQVSARELRDAYALRLDEADSARAATRSDEHLLATEHEEQGSYDNLEDLLAALA
jgi:hypothetical protein